VGEEFRVVLIGAGSLTFTPSLLKGLAGSELAERGLTVALVDVDPGALDVMYGVGVRMAERLCEGRMRVEKHLDRRRALEGGGLRDSHHRGGRSEGYAPGRGGAAALRH